MNIITLRGIDFASVEELQDYLQEALEAPEYYGRNLDALYDVLTDVTQETVIRIDTDDMENEEMADYFGRLIRVCRDASAANPSLTLEMKESPAEA